MAGDLAFFTPVSYNRANALITITGKIIGLVKGGKSGRDWITSHQISLWCKILEKAVPKYIIAIQPGEYLCQAGKIKKIPVFDLQHGIIADDNPYYGEVFRMNSPDEVLPDAYLCWDEQSSAPILKWSRARGINTRVIGNPWFQRFIRSSPDDLLVHEALKEGDKIIDNRPCIVVSLQWGLASEYPDKKFNGVMQDALENVIIETAEFYNWILRLHPVQLRGKEKEFVIDYLIKTFGQEKTLAWVLSSEIPLPVVLSKAQLHITDCSTVVVEAGWMGVYSGLLSEHLCPGGKYQTYFINERSIGMANILPQNPEAIKLWIAKTLAKGRGEPTLKDKGQDLELFIEEIAGVRS
jgi:hypothetical protein